MKIACLRSPEEIKVQKAKCTKDILHWIRYFCFIQEPRIIKDRDKPFYPWEYQEKEFEFLVNLIFECAETAYGKKENVAYPKSRDMGISWVVTMVFLWFWQFHGGSFLIGSRKEEEVDATGDMDTPFQKIKYQILKQAETFPTLLPFGFRPTRDMSHMSIRSEGGGQIVGESANPDFGRGGRKLAILFDEFAKWNWAAEAWQSSSESTNLRVAVSTPGENPTDKFARLVHQEDGECIVRRLHWSIHPEKASDLRILPDGTYTSSWYEERKRKEDADVIAKEIDISFPATRKGVMFSNYGFGHQHILLQPVSNRPIIRTWDFGIHFYILFGQTDAYGRVLFHKELYRENAHLEDMRREMLDISMRYFPYHEFVDCGDPYGEYRQNSMQLKSECQALADDPDNPIHVQTAYLGSMKSKDRETSRITLLRKLMTTFCSQTNTPSLLVNPQECPILDRALGGGYKYARDRLKRILPTIENNHPDNEAVDCAGMQALFSIPGGSLGSAYTEPLAIRQNKTTWSKPSLSRRSRRG